LSNLPLDLKIMLFVTKIGRISNTNSEVDISAVETFSQNDYFAGAPIDNLHNRSLPIWFKAFMYQQPPITSINDIVPSNAFADNGILYQRSALFGAEAALAMLAGTARSVEMNAEHYLVRLTLWTSRI
jgi:hypothetical protein